MHFRSLHCMPCTSCTATASALLSEQHQTQAGSRPFKRNSENKSDENTHAFYLFPLLYIYTAFAWHPLIYSFMCTGFEYCIITLTLLSLLFFFLHSFSSSLCSNSGSHTSHELYICISFSYASSLSISLSYAREVKWNKIGWKMLLVFYAAGSFTWLYEPALIPCHISIIIWCTKRQHLLSHTIVCIVALICYIHLNVYDKQLHSKCFMPDSICPKCTLLLSARHRLHHSPQRLHSRAPYIYI